MLVLMLDLYDRNTFKFDQKKWNNGQVSINIQKIIQSFHSALSN